LSIIETTYMVEWPGELVEIGDALASGDLKKLKLLINEFPEPMRRPFYQSASSEEFIEVDAYKIRMPVLFYLCTRSIRRTEPPYNPFELNHDVSALTDEDLKKLSVVVNTSEKYFGEFDNKADENKFLKSKKALLKVKADVLSRLKESSIRFTQFETGFSCSAIKQNAFNYLIGQLREDLNEKNSDCVDIIKTAVALGAKADEDTLLTLAGIEEPWFSIFHKWVPASVKIEPTRTAYIYADADEESSANKLLINNRLQTLTKEGEWSWIQMSVDRPDFIKRLVTEFSHDINHRGYGLQTLLSVAVQEANTELLEVAISLGADTEIADEYGRVPLHYAAKMGIKRYVNLLLENGADKTRKDNKGMLPSDYAKKSKRGQTVLALLES